MLPENRLDHVLSEFGKCAPELLDERQLRLLSGCIAKGYGYGGIKAVSAVTGLDPRTVKAGVTELDQGAALNQDSRIRAEGAGRKSAKELYPDFMEKLESVLRSNTYGDPEKVIWWTNLSLRDMSRILTEEYGIPVGKDVVSRGMEELGFSKQVNQKMDQVGKRHPLRNEIFEYINETAEAYMAQGIPVISTDTKKKELVGNFKNNGQAYRPKYDPLRVLDHDFPIAELGKVSPYGVYVLNDNTGFVNLGTDHDTAEFAVEGIRQWWQHLGIPSFVGKDTIMITCDGGGSNGWRNRLWKYSLALFAEEYKVQVHVCHLPAGTSKWNKVEHRLFCYISKSWAGHPLIDIPTIVNYISHTTTETGLKVECTVDYNDYSTGVKVTDDQFDSIDIEWLGPGKDHSYIIRGLKKCN